jgi:cyanobactin biosynthesis protein (PatB/AcyB/McaB family)
MLCEMLPPFVEPVRRPEFIYQCRIIYFMVKIRRATGDEIFNTIIDLVHGANCNDPQRFLGRNYNQLKSSLHRESLSFRRFGI